VACHKKRAACYSRPPSCIYLSTLADVAVGFFGIGIKGARGVGVNAASHVFNFFGREFACASANQYAFVVRLHWILRLAVTVSLTGFWVDCDYIGMQRPGRADAVEFFRSELASAGSAQHPVVVAFHLFLLCFCDNIYSADR
jgi:hypothetical protein